MSPPDQDVELAHAIAGVYAGPLEEFVANRDALAKTLRAAKRREDADAVKRLRKPSRVAWALDRAVAGDTAAMESLDAAVALTLEAQATGGDVRGAIAALRTAVRVFADRAASAAAQVGHRLEAADLASAVLAVLGRTEALEAMRRGCLAEVPEAGGLDFFASLPAPPVHLAKPADLPPRAAPPPAAVATARPDRAGEGAAEARRAARVAALRAAAKRADDDRASARARAEEAEQTLAETAATLAAAEDRLRAAEDEVRMLRAALERARASKESAGAALHDAEKARAHAQKELDRVTGVES